MVLFMSFKLLYFAGPNQLSSYLPLIQKSLSTSLRPRTSAAYSGQFKTYLQFCVYNDYFQYEDVNLILAFIEFLNFNNISKQSIQNYICAIRHNFLIYDLNPSALAHPKISLQLKSIAINRPLQCKLRGIIDIEFLGLLIDSCHILRYTVLYRSVFLTAFFGFLRLSNICPDTTTNFDFTRHLARGDFILGSPGAHLVIKWSKTNQLRNCHQVVQIPVLSNTNLCPVTALVEMLKHNLGGNNAPLFNIPFSTSPVTQSQVRNALATILQYLKFPQNYLTFHSFRRSGVTLSFNNDVSIQNLKVHGGWRSDAIWTYLKTTNQSAGVVARTFQSSLV